MTNSNWLGHPETPPGGYDRAPAYHDMRQEKDVPVAMRDGVSLSVDVYRPNTEVERFPALLAFAIYNKDLQGPDMAASLPPQPSWAPMWAGLLEAGDTKFFVSRGYVHVVGSPRGIGKSEGGGSREWDCYDLIEWIAAQPWCDGNVGMVGISGFGAEQLAVAKQQPPHLKAIFPFDPRGAYGHLGGFRDEYPGGGAACVSVSHRPLLGHPPEQGAAGTSPTREGEALAGGDEQPGLPGVSAHLQCRSPEGPTHATLFRRSD